MDTDRRLKRPLEIYLPMISLTFLRNRGIFPSVIRRIQKSGDVGMSSHWARDCTENKRPTGYLACQVRASTIRR